MPSKPKKRKPRENRERSFDENTKSSRLTNEQEEEAAALAKQLILAGDDSIPTAVEALVNLSWNIGVNAVTATWPELKPESRTRLLESLSTKSSDAGKRLRLSVARGLFPIDPEATQTIVTNVCEEMRTIGMAPRDRQNFANVFIGKGRPWLLHLPISDWKNPEPLIACAIDSCFNAQCAPFTQILLIRWLSEIKHLEKLDEVALEAIAKTVKRWNPRYQKELKKEVPELPQVLADALTDEPEPETKAEEPLRAAAQPAGAFDVSTALRQIESHVSSLRRELHEARTALRQQETGRGRSRREPAAGQSTDVESLQRHNEQLQETIADLQQRIADLTSDHEARAAAIHSNEDPRAQLIALLGLKLREVYDEFIALRSNAADEVVRQHFGDMLESIFRILEEEGVKLH